MAGFIEKLWDETIAGPTPDRIRNLQSHRSISTSDTRPKLNSDPVSRTIMLLRTRSLSVGSGSDPSSPSPRTPGTPSEDTRRLARKKPAAMEEPDSTSPTDYHWILICALDR